MGVTALGASVKRTEDIRFITGKGHYVDDINRPGQAYAYFLRSPHAHATIDKIDTSAALKAPGVVAIFTGDDMAADKVGGLICGWMIHSKDGSPMKVGAPSRARAQGKVRYVGDPCRRRDRRHLSRRRKDAAEKIVVDYGVLPAVIDTASAAKPGQPQIHDAAPNNTVYNWHLGDKAATDAAFAAAAHVTKLDLVNNRLIPNADGAARRASATTIQARTRSRSIRRARIRTSRGSCCRPSSALRRKTSCASSRPTSAAASARKFSSTPRRPSASGRRRRSTGRSNGPRTEPRPSSPTRTAATMSRMPNSRSTRAARSPGCASIPSPISAPIFRPSRPSVPTYLYGTLLSGQYAIPSIYCEVDAVYTNTAPVDAYRGAGRPEATFVIERIVEIAARETARTLPSSAVQNFIKSFPHQTPVIMAYDVGDYSGRAR